MPAKSKKQERFMQAVANNPEFAKKVGVPTKVGKEFTKETKVKKYKEGGMSEEDKKMFGKKETDLPPPKGFKTKYKTKDQMTEEEKKVLTKPMGKKEGGMLKTPDNPGLKKLPEGVRNKMGYMKKGGKIGMGMTKNNYKKGGKVSSCSKRADGCAVRGKTKGRMV
jgi:hypothetical protein